MKIYIYIYVYYYILNYWKYFWYFWIYFYIFIYFDISWRFTSFSNFDWKWTRTCLEFALEARGAALVSLRGRHFQKIFCKSKILFCMILHPQIQRGGLHPSSQLFKMFNGVETLAICCILSISKSQ